MPSAWRLRLLRLVPGVVIGTLSVQLLLQPHPARTQATLSEVVLRAHPALHHVIDLTPTPPLAQVHPAAAATPARPAAAAVRPSPVFGSRQLALINADRASAGLPPLAWSPCLYAVAAQNAARMAAQGYLSHANGPSLNLACHLGLNAGENVGFTSAGIDDGQLNAMFMNSPEHRANILGAYRAVGAAWVVAASGYGYLAVEFG